MKLIKYNKKLYSFNPLLMVLTGAYGYLLSMKMLQRLGVSGFLLIMTGVGTLFAQERLLSVEAAVQIALDNNLSLMRSAIDVGARKRASDRSWNTLVPTVNAAAVASHPTSVTWSIDPSRDTLSVGLSLSVGITLSTSIIDNIKKAQVDYEQGLLSYESARQELELQIRKLFYYILLLDANRELAAQNFESAQSRYEQSAALARLGQAPRLDELSARVDMENTRPGVRSAQMLYENAMDSFKAILGIATDTEIRLDGSLAGGSIGNIIDAKGGSGESLEAASLRKSIQSMELQRSAARNNAFIPSLRLSWNSSPLYNLQSKDLNDNSGSFSVTLGVNLDNFFPGSAAKTQIDDLSDNISSAHIQLADTVRNRENRVSQYVRTIEGIEGSLEALELNLELAQSTYDMYEDAYRRGAVDYQQLRGAGDSLEQTKNRLLQEQYNLIVAVLDLEKELNIPFGTIFNEEN